MKMAYKYLFIVTFVISSLLFIDHVQADYKATVMNPANTKCPINGKVYNGSSCFYKDKNLNSVSRGLYALDTGDVVTVIENGEQVATKDTNLCSDYYVKATFYFDSVGKTYEGYFCNANLKKDSLLNDDLKNQFKNAGFPESYWDNLAFLKSAHPNWNFVAIDTELTFEEVVQNEWYGSRSLLRRSMSNNYAYLEVGPSSFNYKDDYYIAFDDVTGSDPWYRINTQTISYYLDPRNFLRDMYIFQFKSLAYDRSSSDDKMKEIINKCNGYKILNQSPFEMCISYIISQNNNVKRISNSINLLCKKYGTKVEFNNKEYYLFPTYEQLKNLKSEDFRELGVGFRDKYLEDFLIKYPSLKDINTLSTEEATNELMKVKGIGLKVASCILLFGYKRLDTFPIDTWVKQNIKEIYGIKDDQKTIERFAKEKYKEYSGLAIQYLFHSKRNIK